MFMAGCVVVRLVAGYMGMEALLIFQRRTGLQPDSR